MRVLEYSDLDTSHSRRRLRRALSRFTGALVSTRGLPSKADVQACLRAGMP